MRCLEALKDIGFQIGAGFMVGSPGQTYDTMASDFEYLKAESSYDRIDHLYTMEDTLFSNEADGTLELTLIAFSILRIMFP